MIIIGHRGARNEAPENTLGGFKHIVKLGLTAVEFDVRQLPTGQLVVIHDDNLLRSAGVDVPVDTLNDNNIHQYSHTHLWPNWATVEPTPYLQDVLHLIKHFTHIELEVKAVNHLAAAKRLIHTLMPMLQNPPFLNSVTVTSFDEKILQALQPYPHIKRGLLIEDPYDINQLIQTAKNYHCQQIGFYNKLCQQQDIILTQQAGLKASVWTVNDIARAKQLKAWGVDGLITDVPQTMMDL